MAIQHAQEGEVVDIRPFGPAIAEQATKTLIKTAEIEVIRLVILKGKGIAEHKARGPIVVQCLEGAVGFTVAGEAHELRGGDLLHLSAGVPHALQATEDTSLLLTIVLNQGGK